MGEIELLRAVEVAWLSGQLSMWMANLSYPVGMGIEPLDNHVQSLAETLFARYANMIEMARSALPRS
jgi:hypothetical protein